MTKDSSNALAPVLLGVVLAVLVISGTFTLAVGPLFGTPFSILFPMVAALSGLLAAVGLASFGSRCQEIASAAFGLTCLPLALASVLAPSLNDSYLAFSARVQVQKVEDAQGRSPLVKGMVELATRNREQVVAHRAQLREVVSATTNKEAVSRHLLLASALKMETPFVSGNLMVRLQDEQAILDRARQLASEGDAQAVGVLAALGAGVD